MRDELIGEGLPVFQTMIRRSTAGVTRAVLQGVPLRDLPGKYRLAWLDYQALGKEIVEIIRGYTMTEKQSKYGALIRQAVKPANRKTREPKEMVNLCAKVPKSYRQH
jgi:hypothetical protein